MAQLVLAAVVSIIGGAALFRSHWFGFRDFGLPRDHDGGVEGQFTLLGIHFLGGWSFSVISAFAQIPGAQPQKSALAWGIVGILVMAVYRVRSLTRNYRLEYLRSPSSGTNEAVVFGLPLAFGAIVFFAGAGDFSTFISNAAPGPAGLSIALLLTAGLAASIVEVVWYFWSHLPSYRSNLTRICRALVHAVMREPAGVFALEVHYFVSKSYEPKSLKAISDAFPDAAEDQLDDAIRALVMNQLLVPVDVSAVRRHPEFFAVQRQLVSEQLERIGIESLQIADVEGLLDSDKSHGPYTPPPALYSHLNRVGGEVGDAIAKLLYDVLRGVESSDERERKMAGRYLRLRYWEGLRGEDVADKLGYSREHVVRSIRPKALQVFSDELRERLSSDIPALPSEE
jgi:hypothetical protein